MHFDEKSSSGSLWGRRVVGRVGGRGAGVSPPIHSPSPAWPTTAVEPAAVACAACLGCALLTTPPSLILMSFLLSILPRAFKPLANCN